MKGQKHCALQSRTSIKAISGYIGSILSKISRKCCHTNFDIFMLRRLSNAHNFFSLFIVIPQPHRISFRQPISGHDLLFISIIITQVGVLVKHPKPTNSITLKYQQQSIKQQIPGVKLIRHYVDVKILIELFVHPHQAMTSLAVDPFAQTNISEFCFFVYFSSLVIFRDKK